MERTVSISNDINEFEIPVFVGVVSWSEAGVRVKDFFSEVCWYVEYYITVETGFFHCFVVVMFIFFI